MFNQQQNKLPHILYSCYFNRTWQGEQFIPEHVFSYQIAGTLTVNDGSKTLVCNEGEFRFIRRNQLLKFIKQPPANGGEFKAVSVYLDQDMLRNFSLWHGYQAEKPVANHALIPLPVHELYKSYMDSLLPYLQGGNSMSESIQLLKVKEAILLLLQTMPDLKNVLFDFTEPGKIDLEAFMNKNFHFNVELKRFAYLTGRSLATFKRDFEKIFHISPSKWLQQKRLQEAHYRICQKGVAPSDVYLDVGFQDLSHFSFAFKKMFGIAPSRLAKAV